MAWTTPTTRATGDLITASIWNADIVENLKHVFPPSVLVTRTASVLISNNVATTVTWDSEKFDDDTMHDLVTNPTRLTATKAGRYLIYAQIQWASVVTGTGVRTLDFFHNGATRIGRDVRKPLDGAVSNQSLAIIYSLAATDYVTCVIQHNQGSDINLEQSSDYTPMFGMTRLGGL